MKKNLLDHYELTLVIAWVGLNRMIFVYLILFISSLSLGEVTIVPTFAALNGPYKENIENHQNWKKKIQVFGAKGEIRSFIVRVPSAQNGKIKWRWQKKGGVVAPIPKMVLFKMDKVLIKQSSYSEKKFFKVFDPLIPLKDLVVPKSKEIEFYWVDFEIPKKMIKGIHAAHLDIGTLSLSADLEVLDWELSNKVSLQSYTELNPWYISLAHFGAWDNREKSLSTEYFKELRAHRIYTTKSWRELIQWTPKGIRQFFLANQFVFDSSSSNIGIDFPPPGVQKPQKELIKDLIAMETWALSKKPQKYFIYYLDEPTEAQIQASLEHIAIIKKYAPTIKIMVTTEPKQELFSMVDIFVPVMNYYKASWKVPAGKELWWYISCMSHGCGEHENPGAPDLVLDRSESYVLSIGPLSWQKKIDGFLYFHANYNFQFAPKKDPWTDLYYFSGNGDGDLFYPGKPGQHFSHSHQPVPSIRLKLWRETSYLHEYLSQLQSLNPQSPLLQSVNIDFNSVFDWPRSLEYYLDLKQQLFENIKKSLKLTKKLNNTNRS